MIETEKTELQTGPESWWTSCSMHLERNGRVVRLQVFAYVCYHMTIEPKKRDILGKLNARIAPVGALIGLISGVISGIAKISEYAREWSDVILLVLTIIAYMSIQIVFFSFMMYALLTWLLSKFIGDDGAAIVALVLGTIASVGLNLSHSPEPDAISVFVGFLVVAYGVWLLIKKLVLQPSGAN